MGLVGVAEPVGDVGFGFGTAFDAASLTDVGAWAVSEFARDVYACVARIDRRSVAADKDTV